MSFGNRLSFDPVRIMLAGEYFNNNSKKEGERDGATQGGHYQDEIARVGDESIWFYHGNPIASFNHVTKEWKRSSCGWQTNTTKVRLNALAGERTGLYVIYQVNSEWKYGWSKGSELFEDQEIRPTWHSYDAWRGHFLPPFAVAAVSNTGGWSDSPARPEDGEKELSSLSRELLKAGIKTFKSWAATSNIFCVKVYLNVKGKDWEAASKIAGEWLAAHENDTRLIHAVR